MSTTTTVTVTRVVLGAGDPEMAACAALARTHGLEVIQAQAPNQTGALAPVSPFNAYNATQPAPQAGDIWIEAAPADGGKPAVRGMGGEIVDHHQPGDSGFGVGPEGAISASSLGQLAALLGVELDSTQRTVAAADHCLAAAFAGQVPGVTPGDVLETRIASAAAFERRPTEELQAEIVFALDALETASQLRIGDVEVADLRGFLPPETAPERADAGGVPGLHHAGPMTGQAYIAWVREASSRGGRLKVVIGGAGAGTAAGTAPITAFLEGWALEEGLCEPYGDAVRGFAGAYPRPT
jgi:hypothetical protein